MPDAPVSASTQTHEHVAPLPAPWLFFAASLALGLFFVVWTWLHHPWLPTASFDLTCALHWQAWSEANPRFTGLMVYLTDLGGIAGNTLVAVLGAFWQNSLKQRRLAIAWLAIVLGGAILNQGFKDVFGRQRPDNPDAVVHERNASYPSGHAMGSLIGYGMLGYAMILPQPRRPGRVATLTFLTILIAAIGFSRIYLRAHWFSDVVAGWTLGLAWLFLCIGWLEKRRRRALVQ